MYIMNRACKDGEGGMAKVRKSIQTGENEAGVRRPGEMIPRSEAKNTWQDRGSMGGKQGEIKKKCSN